MIALYLLRLFPAPNFKLGFMGTADGVRCGAWVGASTVAAPGWNGDIIHPVLLPHRITGRSEIRVV